MACGKWMMTTLAFLSLGSPGSLVAQVMDSATSENAVAEMTVEELRAFARLQAELEPLQAEYRERLGTTHEDGAKRELQLEMRRSVAELLERHGMTEEEHQSTLFIISSDVERLELFKRLLDEAARSP